MPKLTNEVLKNLKNETYYDADNFIKDVKCYIKALKAGRVQYTVTHVSNSGMSRNIHIQSYEGTKIKGYFRNYTMMLKMLNYNFDKYGNDIKVGGCGMDMLFATNYSLIHNFKSMRFITKKTCDILAQKI